MGHNGVVYTLCDISRSIPQNFTIVDPLDPTRRKCFPAGTEHEDILVPAVRNGKVVYQNPSIQQIRERAQCQISQLHDGIRRFVNPHQYPVGLESGLHEFKTELIIKARQHSF